jgi:LPXTG-motif cell wall-anchored protein
MKTIASIVAAFVLTLSLILPAHAQDSIGPLQFRVALHGPPCPNATYWGVLTTIRRDIISEQPIFVQLTDPDGDGVYTGSYTAAFDFPVEFHVRLEQGTGVFMGDPLAGIVRPHPGQPSFTIWDFGQITLAEEETLLEASVAGCPGEAPSTGVSDGTPVALPDTGASAWLPFLPLAGSALFLVVGFYFRKRVWQ